MAHRKHAARVAIDPRTLDLTLLAQVGLEPREDAEHIEEAFARGRRGIDWLLSGLERGTLFTARTMSCW
jgi:hypothetical protein